MPPWTAVAYSFSSVPSLRNFHTCPSPKRVLPGMCGIVVCMRAAISGLIEAPTTCSPNSSAPSRVKLTCE
jgi:hypothetical protein